MRHAAFAGVSILALAHSTSALASARYLDLEAAVATADAVAVVQIDTSEKLAARDKVEKGSWTYGQKNGFRFVEFFKRAPFVAPTSKAPQTLWAEKDFICASESFRPGAYLVFLESVDAGEWTPVNHAKGVLRIEQNAVGWPYGAGIGEKLSLQAAKSAVVQAKASGGPVRFRAEIVGSFYGDYNRWLAARSHQVLVFHLDEGAPTPWPAERLFVRAVVPRGVAGETAYKAWVERDGRLDVTADWIDGSLVIREARRTKDP